MKNKAIYIIQQLACVAIPVLLTGTIIIQHWLLAALFLCGTILLAWGIFDIRLSLFVKTTNKLPSGEKKVALTFDDGLCGQTAEILDILEREQVTATFFITGKTVKQYEPLLRKMQQQGHAIGTHTQDHSLRFPTMMPRNARKEMEIGIQSLATVLGKRPVLFRPPFGITNPAIAYIVRSLRLQNTGWSLRSLDTKIQDGEKLEKRILGKLKPGQIILLHDSQSVTLEMLPGLIAQIKKQGYCFVGLS